VKWASVFSEKPKVDAAVKECLDDLKTRLENGPPEIVFLFVSPHFSQDYSRLAGMITEATKAKALVGCSAAGIIGGGHEIEQRPALSLTAGYLPDVNIMTFHLRDKDLPDLDASPKVWERALGVNANIQPHFVLLADPFTIRAENLTLGLDYAFPKSTKVGGLASGARNAGGNALFLGKETLSEGVVGAVFSGNIQIDTVVAQGCRPIGNVYKVTEAQGNVLLSLNNKLPLQVIQEIYQSSCQKDRELIQNSLFFGLLTDPLKKQINPGDFLIRNIIGLDSKKGYLAIGAELREGQTVQFHLRDAQTSAEDLKMALSRYVKDLGSMTAPSSALLFSCVGRGIHLYGHADHDTDVFRSHAGQVPLGGFFCNGEIGPVGGTTYLHGYTSCFGIFRPRSTNS